MAVRSVAVLGAGIMGASTALFLARRGLQVVLFDSADAPFSGASRWNEGRIHLGYVYSAAPTFRTAHLLLPGGLAFKRLVEELIGCSLAPSTAEQDEIFLIHRDSVVPAEAARAYYESIASLVREHPEASDYLADGRQSRVVPLTRAELDEVACPGDFVAGFRLLERSVWTPWVADAFVDALRAEPRLTLAMGERIVDVTTTDTGHGSWHVHSTTGVHGPFDAVVNALWHGRPAIDRRVADCADRDRNYRYKVAVFARSSRPLPSIPSVLIGVGPYGDIKNYTGREFYLSWYPVGRLVESDGEGEPVTPALDAAQRQQLAARTFDALCGILPAASTIREHAQDLAVEGGWIYAQAHGSIGDPRSSLHRRDRLGVKWFGSYASVDTGKYSVAPYLAQAIAARIAGE